MNIPESLITSSGKKILNERFQVKKFELADSFCFVRFTRSLVAPIALHIYNYYGIFTMDYNVKTMTFEDTLMETGCFLVINLAFSGLLLISYGFSPCSFSQVKLGTMDQSEAQVEWVIRPYMNTAKKQKILGD